jgi:hypothetical protein
MPTGPGDDTTILGSDSVFRRVPPSQAPYNENRQCRWPSSAVLLPNAEDNNEVSVYLGSLLIEYDLNPIDVLEGHDDYGLIMFPASSARAAGYGIRRDPELNSKRPLKVDPAHAVLTGTPLTSKQRRKPARALLEDERIVLVKEPQGDDSSSGKS